MFYKGHEDREKRLRFSIRKVSFGAASVAVAAIFMFSGNGAVYAAEPNVTATDSALAATPANNQLDENSATSEAIAPKGQEETAANATPTPVVSSTISATEEANSSEKNEAVTKTQSDEDTVSGDSSSSKSTESSEASKSEGERTRTEEASSKPRVRRRRDTESTPTATATDNDPDANQTYTAPGESTNVEELAMKLKNLPEKVENETKLGKIDEVGDTKSIKRGEVTELNEFGGWKAVGGGKFAVARKTAEGVFPIETVNTVRTDGGKDQTWLNESSFERSNNYALFLGLVRTGATKEEVVDDGSVYTNGRDISNKGKGVKKYKGIEKTFKNYSLETGSDVTVSFYTGITGDIDGNKAGYKVEVLTKQADGIEKTIYNQSFYPQNSYSDAEKKLQDLICHLMPNSKLKDLNQKLIKKN